MTTGQRIYEARRKAGMTQEELADKLGVTRQAVSMWESDAAYPETDKIVELCKMFGLSADELLLGAERTEERAEEPQPIAEPQPILDEEPIAEAEPIAEKEPAKEEKPKCWSFDKEHLHFEYTSKIKLGKLPLLHINIGLGAYRAKGVFAIGNMATGICSLGFLAIGALSMGLLSVGLFAFGMLAFGLLMGAGGVATGLVAFGGIAIGVLCFGGVAIGYISVGGYAIGQYAMGGIARGSLFAAGTIYAGGSSNSFLMPRDYEKLRDFLHDSALDGIIYNLIRDIALQLRIR